MHAPRRGNDDRGQAVGLVVAIIAVTAMLAVALAVFAGNAADAARARTAADAAALAGVTGGRAAASAVAHENGATVVSFMTRGPEHDRRVAVTVRVGRARATAAASNRGDPTAAPVAARWRAAAQSDVGETSASGFDDERARRRHRRVGRPLDVRDDAEVGVQLVGGDPAAQIAPTMVAEAQPRVAVESRGAPIRATPLPTLEPVASPDDQADQAERAEHHAGAVTAELGPGARATPPSITGHGTDVVRPVSGDPLLGALPASSAAANGTTRHEPAAAAPPADPITPGPAATADDTDEQALVLAPPVASPPSATPSAAVPTASSPPPSAPPPSAPAPSTVLAASPASPWASAAAAGSANAWGPSSPPGAAPRAPNSPPGYAPGASGPPTTATRSSNRGARASSATRPTGGTAVHAPAPGRKARVRRVTRVVRHVDPWSIFKIATVFSFVAYGVTLISGVLLWNVAYATGTIDNIESGLESTGWSSFELKGDEIFRNAWIGGLFVTVGLIGLAVLLATLFNLVTDLVGGVRFTVLEEEVIEKPARSTTAPASGRGRAGASPRRRK